MKNKQTIKLKLSKYFNEIGLVRPSIFKWVSNDLNTNYQLVYADGYNWSDYPCYAGYKYIYNAYTFEELANMIDIEDLVFHIEANGSIDVRALGEYIAVNLDKLNFNPNAKK